MNRLSFDDALIEGQPVRGTPYVFVRKLGSGTQGTALLVRDPDLDRLVVLKIQRDLREGETILRFRQEGQILTSLRHRSIVQVFHSGMLPDGFPYLAMEYVDGQTLRELIQARGTISVAETVSMMAQLLDGLEVAHRANVIHRDIKPANIFVGSSSNGGVLKLFDFGIAKKVIDESMNNARPTPEDKITAFGAIIGSPGYMSPEQAQALVLRPPADLYAVGCVIFQMLVGRIPFIGDNHEVLSHHVSTPAPRLAHYARERVPPELDGLVDQLLSKDAQRRPQSAAEVADRLRSIGRQLQVVVGSEAGAEDVTISVADPHAIFDAPTRASSARPSSAAIASADNQDTDRVASVILAPTEGTDADLRSVAHPAPAPSMPLSELREGTTVPARRLPAPAAPRSRWGLVAAALLLGVVGGGAIVAVTLIGKGESSSKADPRSPQPVDTTAPAPSMSASQVSSAATTALPDPTPILASATAAPSPPSATAKPSVNVPVKPPKAAMTATAPAPTTVVAVKPTTSAAPPPPAASSTAASPFGAFEHRK